MILLSVAGANPSDIIIDYDGVKNISLDNEGSLVDSARR